jgi:anti-sigma factor RsiW
MKCELTETALHGYFDGELDAVRAAEFERHLEHCAVCRASLDRVEVLHVRLQQGDLSESASPHLREQVRKQLALNRGTARAREIVWRKWLYVPAFAVLAAVAAVSVTLLLIQSRAQTGRIAAEAVDANIRSLEPGHLTDVQSTDQHTVKPWFDGKLVFSPPVADYAKEGFPLVGGRLDVIEGQDVAALVYGRHKHFINLFVWPAGGSERLADGSGARHGYNWLSWQQGGMQLYLVSDVAAGDLEKLKNLILR